MRDHLHGDLALFAMLGPLPKCRRVQNKPFPPRPSSLLSAVAGWTFTRTYNLTSNRATTFTTSVGTWSSLCSMHC